MRLDAAFRLSTYLSLVTASVCLVYADQVFLPGITGFGAVMGVVLVCAFVLEGRWALSLEAANALGLVIAAGAGFWIAYQLLQPAGSSATDLTPATAILPSLGPVLMVILAAKLLRPKKVNDFWGLHSIGMLEVILACVLASQPLFGLLLVTYLGFLVWSLTLFCLYRARAASGDGAVPFGSVVGAAPQTPLPASLPWRWLGAFPAARWTALVLVFGVLLFLLTPQRRGSHWDPEALGGRSGGQIGTGFTSTMDLNRTGQLHGMEKVALKVYAQNADGSPKLDLDPQQRWRGATVDSYENGRWTNRTHPVAVPRRDSRAGPRPLRLPDLGARQYFLTIEVDPETLKNQLFLAEPVIVAPRRKVVPVVFLARQAFAAQSNAEEMLEWDEFLWPAPRSAFAVYTQVTRPVSEPEVSAPVGPDEIADEHEFCRLPVPGISSLTAEVVDRLVAQGRLLHGDFRPEGFAGGDAVVLPGQREKVARALCNYLALSGEYGYTLNVQRQDPDLDPVEDFLRNSKRGHCERFAAGLALMLRSCGIPSRVVLGFRGAESVGEGQYVVRHSHAHSWVEALVSRGGHERRWLTLDPTPATETLVGGPAALSRSGRFQLVEWWKNYILDYNPSQQSEATAALGQKAAALVPWPGSAPHSTGFWAGLGVWVVGPVAAWLLIRYARRRRLRRGQPEAALPVRADFYGRLLRVLARRLRLIPSAPQTPQEFGDRAAHALAQRTAQTGLARVPARVVCLYYRVRYGDRPLTSAEHQEVDRRIGEVDAALREGSPG